MASPSTTGPNARTTSMVCVPMSLEPPGEGDFHALLGTAQDGVELVGAYDVDKLRRVGHQVVPPVFDPHPGYAIQDVEAYALQDHPACLLDPLQVPELLSGALVSPVRGDYERGAFLDLPAFEQL